MSGAEIERECNTHPDQALGDRQLVRQVTRPVAKRVQQCPSIVQRRLADKLWMLMEQCTKGLHVARFDCGADALDRFHGCNFPRLIGHKVLVKASCAK